MQTLGGRQETLVTRERALLESLTEFLTGFGAPTADVELLRRTLTDMGDPFLLVVVGEFNVSKSAFINALVNEDVTAEGSLPRSDLVLFLTSAERPFSESEREYMRIIRDWGKKIIVVVTKVDVLAGDDKGKMQTFVQDQVRTLLGLTPPMFMISFRVARKGKTSDDGAGRALCKRAASTSLKGTPVTSWVRKTSRTSSCRALWAWPRSS